MSRMLREEDVLRAVLRTHYDWSHDHGDPLDVGLREAIEQAIRALPAADDPRAEAAERLASVEAAMEDASTGVEEGLFLEDTDELIEWWTLADEERNEALAAYREAGG